MWPRNWGSAVHGTTRHIINHGSGDKGSVTSDEDAPDPYERLSRTKFRFFRGSCHLPGELTNWLSTCGSSRLSEARVLYTAGEFGNVVLHKITQHPLYATDKNNSVSSFDLAIWKIVRRKIHP